MDIDKIENSIAQHYITIEELKKVKERVEASETEDIRIKIETKHWYGYSESHLAKEKHKLNINKYTAQILVEAAMNAEKAHIDKLIDMEIEAKERSDTKQ